MLRREERTFLRQPRPLVRLQPFLPVFPQDGGIRPGLGERQLHLLAEDLEALQFLDGLLRAALIVVDDEGLAFALQALLRDDVNDGAVFGEEVAEGGSQKGDLDTLVEVADVDSVERG